MDAKADNKDTLMSLLYDLHDKFIKPQRHNYLVIEGDAKVYELLQALKTDYRDGLKWVVPLPGAVADPGRGGPNQRCTMWETFA